MREPQQTRWLVLIHQLPPKPNYFRVKIWRHLQRLGAMAIKDSVYVLPVSAQARESFEWVRREIVAGRGEASLCEAQLLAGLTNGQIIAMFRKASDEAYAQLAKQAEGVLKRSAARSTRDRGQPDPELARLRRRLAAIAETDFFTASGHRPVERLLQQLESQVSQRGTPNQSKPLTPVELRKLKGSVWVTRREVYVDRMASAWLIRRFLDTRARFKFVPEQEASPAKGEIRFDMFEAEFTHEGDRCTFEVLLERMGFKDPALRQIAELVHEVDVKDGKFLRDDIVGFECVLSGIAHAHRDDQTRLERSAAVLDDLYAYFRASGNKLLKEQRR